MTEAVAGARHLPHDISHELWREYDLPASGQSFLWATAPTPALAEPQNVYDGVQRIVDCEAGVVIYTLKDMYPGVGLVGGVSALPLAETTLGDVCK